MIFVVIGAIFGLFKALFSAPDPRDGSDPNIHGSELGAQNAVLKHIESGHLNVPVLG